MGACSPQQHSGWGPVCMKDQGYPGEVGLVAEPIWRRSLGTEPHATFPPLGAGAAGHWVQTKEGLCRVTAAGYGGGRGDCFLAAVVQCSKRASVSLFVQWDLTPGASEGLPSLTCSGAAPKRFGQRRHEGRGWPSFGW